MQPPPERAQIHYAQRRLVATSAASAAARQWATVDPAAVAVSWGQRVPVLAASVAAAQVLAASAADPYVTSVLAADGGAPAGAAVVAAAFAGAAADGRDLASLLMMPAVTTLAALRRGVLVDDALGLGGAQLATMVRTEVADAGRVADQVASTAAPAASGYVRIVVGKTCSRCIILAGRVYRWSQGFERHPNCDCQMLPVAAARAAGFVQSPQRVYASMTAEERSAAGWSKAEQAAIAAGADISAVTNIHRKGALHTAGGLRLTRESTTRRGLYGGYVVDQQTGQLRRRRPGEKAVGRLTPESIYRLAGDDRDLAVRLLRRFGYLR